MRKKSSERGNQSHVNKRYSDVALGIRMPSLQHNVPVEFIRLADRIGIAPERFAELLCSTAVEINPDGLTIIGKLSEDVQNVTSFLC